MNILFLSESYYPHGGGAELATYLYARLLSKAEFNVIVITNRFPGEAEVSKSGNSTVYRLHLFEEGKCNKYSVLGRFDVLCSRLVRKKIAWADVVYIPRFWYSAILLAKIYGKPTITHLHDYAPLCSLSTNYDISRNRVCNSKHKVHCSGCIYAYEKSTGKSIARTLASAMLNSTVGYCIARFVNLSDAIICASRAQRNMIVESERSLREKISVIHNPLPEVGYSDNEGHDFAYFGGPNLLKGFHILYQAAKHMNQSNKTRTNIHISDFSQVSNTFSERLRENGFILYKRLGGYSYDEVYAKVRCVIVPSIGLEVFPYVAIEGLLRGKLLLASNVGGIPEILEGCDGAFMFPVGDSNKLAEEMQHVSDSNDDVVKDLGIKNRKRVEERFDNRKTIRDFIRLMQCVAI